MKEPELNIILISEQGYTIAKKLKQEFKDATIYTRIPKLEDTTPINDLNSFLEKNFSKSEALVFIGALGICIRSIAPFIQHKYKDPAVVSIDSTGKHIISVLSGHVGGANTLSKRIAHILGSKAIITTQSDNNHLWALDTIGDEYHWKMTTSSKNFTEPIALFVSKKPTALLLDIRDKGTFFLENNCPKHVDIFYNYKDISWENFDLLIAVTPYLYEDTAIPTLFYRPKVLHLGIGCRKQCIPENIPEYIEQQINKAALSPDSLASIATITLKKDEPLLEALQNHFDYLPIHIYSPEDLENIPLPNPSQKVKEVTTIFGVSESTALRSANLGRLLIEKQKGVFSKGNDFTFAVALSKEAIREGHIEIVGAGPGDPDLVSVRGRAFLEQADLILYAGSLVPIELTHCAKEGATVRSSAAMDLEEQFTIMKAFYKQGKLIVRLHTGDPCIYGAIQEQMQFFDKHNMSYHITPGISSFQAAAAALNSQFTIPEKVQTIILTRGEGRTPMPEKEQLNLLARSQSTMCIFLSANIVEKVQQDLLMHYPPHTPIAACYKLTWKDESIYRGELKDLTKIIRNNNLTLTTMIVVGEAIGNRSGFSKLYAHHFKHLYRK